MVKPKYIITNLHNLVIKVDVKSINLVGNKSCVNFVNGLKKRYSWFSFFVFVSEYNY